MYEIVDVIHDYLFVTLRLRNVRTDASRPQSSLQPQSESCLTG